MNPQQTTSDVWPGAFGLYNTSKAAIKLNWVPLLLLVLASLIISALGDIFFKGDIQIVGDIISFIFSSLVSVSIYIVTLAGVRGKKVILGNVIKDSLPYWVPMILLTLLLIVISIVSFLVLIVPFFLIFPRLVLATYYLVDKNLDPIDSLKASWAATDGQLINIYGIIGANLAMALLIFTIVGIPFAFYFLFMYSAATALLYVFVGKQSDTPSKPSTV